MPENKPQNLYGTFGSVPTSENQGAAPARENIQASSEAFGGQIGKAISTAGGQAEEIGNHFGQMAAEAKVNDDYANKYTPAAADLRQKYDMLRGQDKVGGYDNYISSLQNLNKQFTASQPGIYGQKVMSSLIDRHITGEIEGAKRELVASQKDFSDQSRKDLIMANNQLAANNYNNPDLVKSVEDQNNNHLMLQHIDAGHDPNNEISQSIIEQAQNANKGSMATDMINRAVSSGDSISANALRANYADVIPGYQKIALDNTLHTQNIQQTSTATVNNLKNGKPVPEAIGAPPSKIQALVANTAKSSAVEPNDALTVLRIESSNGQNLGTRGTLGQDKESAGKSVEEQAKALCDNLKTAKTQATNALGRDAEPWEAYVTYQQGAGGGPALLKAAQDNPNGRAIIVFSGFADNNLSNTSRISSVIGARNLATVL